MLLSSLVLSAMLIATPLYEPVPITCPTYTEVKVAYNPADFELTLCLYVGGTVPAAKRAIEDMITRDVRVHFDNWTGWQFESGDLEGWVAYYTTGNELRKVSLRQLDTGGVYVEVFTLEGN